MPRTFVRRSRVVRPTSRQRVLQPKFQDEYWWIQGSSIEKMVMAEFVRRGIFFEHTPQFNSVGGMVPPSWEADFLLPQYKIWIECQGVYFHTLPGAIEGDAYRFAVIEASGWKPIFWWESDIRTRLWDLMNEVPEFVRVDAALNRSQEGFPFKEGGVGIDHLKGLRTALARRTRTPQFSFKWRTKRRPK